MGLKGARQARGFGFGHTLSIRSRKDRDEEEHGLERFSTRVKKSVVTSLRGLARRRYDSSDRDESSHSEDDYHSSGSERGGRSVDDNRDDVDDRRRDNEFYDYFQNNVQPEINRKRQDDRFRRSWSSSDGSLDSEHRRSSVMNSIRARSKSTKSGRLGICCLFSVLVICGLVACGIIFQDEIAALDLVQKVLKGGKSEPSQRPSSAPSTSSPPSYIIDMPSIPPTEKITRDELGLSPSPEPSRRTSVFPSTEPSSGPIDQPSILLSRGPSNVPSAGPSAAPSSGPSVSPTKDPTSAPIRMFMSAAPRVSVSPSSGPTVSPTYSSAEPSVRGSVSPSSGPTASPPSGPTASPSSGPTASPTEAPIVSPSESPTMDPTGIPTQFCSTYNGRKTHYANLAVNYFYDPNVSDGSRYVETIEWLANDDTLFDICTENDTLLMERFVWALVFFEMGRSDDEPYSFYGYLDSVLPHCNRADEQGNDWYVVCNAQGRITEFVISGNGYNEGIFPFELAHLDNLQKLVLNNSPKVTGSVPNELFTLPDLEHLDLSNNGMSGKLFPPAFFAANNANPPSNRLRVLKLGTDASFLSNWWTFDFKLLKEPNTEQLKLAPVVSTTMNDFLSSTFPADELLSFQKLEVLHLAHANLVGNLPDLHSITTLKSVSLWGNSLVGTIPTFPPSIEVIRLKSNLLTGTIPDYYNFFTNLTALELGNNPLSGTIPSNLGELTNLKSLYLCKYVALIFLCVIFFHR